MSSDVKRAMKRSEDVSRQVDRCCAGLTTRMLQLKLSCEIYFSGHVVWRPETTPGLFGDFWVSKSGLSSFRLSTANLGDKVFFLQCLDSELKADAAHGGRITLDVFVFNALNRRSKPCEDTLKLFVDVGTDDW